MHPSFLSVSAPPSTPSVIGVFRGKRVMFDCGIHPGHEGLASLPLFDHVEMASVNLALITHFHLDHCAAVPYLTSQSGFNGRLFMTHPTKAIYRTLLSDFLRVSQNADSQLYTEVDLENSMEKIEVIDFNQTLDIDGIKARETVEDDGVGSMSCCLSRFGPIEQDTSWERRCSWSTSTACGRCTRETTVASRIAICPAPISPHSSPTSVCLSATLTLSSSWVQ